MRKFSSFAPILFALPLAACFDAEMTLKFPDDNTAEATMVMIASADFYEMSAAGGEDFCDGGVEEQLADGSYSCTETFTGTIEEAVNNPDIGDGLTVERRDGGLLFVSFDLTEVTDDIAPPEEAGGEEMMAMMAEAFAGHGISINIGGGEIVETNGTLSDDGKMSSFAIPLGEMITGQLDLPASFDTLLRPGT